MFQYSTEEKKENKDIKDARIEIEHEKAISSNVNSIHRVLSNVYYLFATFLIAATCLALMKVYLKDLEGNLGQLDEVIITVFEILFVVVSVSTLIEHVQRKSRLNELDNRLAKYENVIAAAELLQNSRKNSGLAGIVQSPEEENIFERLSKSKFNKDNAPEIWWMNFRIEKYDTFSKSIRDFVTSGGKVHLITTHPNNPNIRFRLNEAYGDEKSYESYRDHFYTQAEEFIRLQKQLSNVDGIGEFSVHFNEGTPASPLFIVTQDLDVKAYSGFYLNDISGAAPYIVWETAAEGMVKKFIEYLKHKKKFSLSASDLEPLLLNWRENVAKDVLTGVKRNNNRKISSRRDVRDNAV